MQDVFSIVDELASMPKIMLSNFEGNVDKKHPFL